MELEFIEEFRLISRKAFARTPLQQSMAYNADDQGVQGENGRGDQAASRRLTHATFNLPT
jgi:hypothetical protein